MRLAGKVALITGAASGMGAAEARLFAREGTAVALADRLMNQGHSLAAEIEDAGGKAIFLALDVTDDAAWQATVAAVVDRLGRLDILVNNAGISTTGADVPMSEGEWDRLMDVNAKGAFLGLRHAVPAMERTGGGAVVNIGSIAAFNGDGPRRPSRRGRGGCAVPGVGRFLVHHRRGPRSRRRHAGRVGRTMACLQGKIAIVTGGGSGIGAATVRRFRLEGARVVIADIDLSAA